MKSILYRLGLSCLLLAGLAAALQAAPSILKTESISLAPGAASVVRQGQIQGQGVIDYKLSAKKGQVLSIGLVAENRSLHFNLLETGTGAVLFAGESSGNQFEDVLPKDGEYTIRIHLVGGAAHKLLPSSYKLAQRLAAAAP